MTLVILGGGVAEASGAVGGIVYSRNRYGSYIRNRSVPVNPNSSRQQTARTIFTETAERWNDTLTAAQRTAWNLYGSSVVMKNKLGQDIYLSGFAHYIRSNCACRLAVPNWVDDGPTDFTLPSADALFSCTISEATQLITVTFTDTAAWCTENTAFFMVSMSQPRPASRTFIGGPYRYADSIDGSPGSPPSSPQTIAVPFAVAEGQVVIVEARIGRSDGRLSEPFLDTVSVAA